MFDVISLTSRIEKLDIPGIKHRIVKYLPAYLLKFGYVDLDGLGRFKLDAHSSYIDHAASRIYPPFYDVSFDQGQYSQANDYIAYLSKRLGLDDALIAEVMANYAMSIRHQLDHEESVNVEGLGTLLIQGKTTLYFDSDEAFWGKTSIQDLSVSFKPVPRIKDQVEKQVTSTLVQSHKQEPTPVIPEVELDFPVDDLEQEWEASLEEEVVSSSPEVVVEPQHSIKKEDSEVALERDVKTEEIIVPVTVPIVEPEEVVMKVDNTRMDKQPIIDPGQNQVTNSSQTKNHRWLVPLMLGLLFVIALPLFLYLTNRDSAQSDLAALEIPQERLNQSPAQISEAEPSSDDVQNENDAVPASDQALEEQSSTKSKLIDKTVNPESNIEANTSKVLKNNKLKDSNSIITSGDCVIVVGAFSENVNMRQMMSKLEARGFKVYVDSARSLSRVGAYSTCQSDELARNLSIIKSDIEPSSWILNR